MTEKMEVAGMAMIMYKTGDPCPCCGQPIKLTKQADLYALSMLAHLLGLNEVGRTEQVLRAAEERRRGARLPEGMV